jgi:hypothetical protein
MPRCNGQPGDVAAVHLQALVEVTLKEPAPSFAVTKSPSGEIEYVHAGGGGGERWGRRRRRRRARRLCDEESLTVTLIHPDR